MLDNLAQFLDLIYSIMLGGGSETLNFLAQFLAITSCAIIIWRLEPALNCMRHSSPDLVRVAFLLILAASFGAIVYIALGDVPPWPSVIGAMGTATLLLCERRIRYLARHPKEVQHELSSNP